MNEEIRTTTVQYSGYFQRQIRQSLEQGKVAGVTEEAIFQKKLEEERAKVQPVAEAEVEVIENNQPRGYDAQGRLIEKYESGNLGKRIDIII